MPTPSPKDMKEFQKELAHLINEHSIENEVHLPDFLLAKLIVNFITTQVPVFKETLDWYRTACPPEPEPVGDDAEEIEMEDKLTASEALFGFMAWLSGRKDVVKIGSSEECAGLPSLIQTFCDENKLKDPREGWENNLIHPCPVKEETNA